MTWKPADKDYIEEQLESVEERLNAKIQELAQAIDKKLERKLEWAEGPFPAFRPNLDPETRLGLTDQEIHTILAALRYYQGEGMGDPYKRSDEIHDIATNCDSVTSLDDQGIDELCLYLYTGSRP